APRADVQIGSGASTLSWDVTIPAGGEVLLRWSLAVTDEGAILGPPTRPGFSAPQVSADDRRLPAVVDRSVEDLVGLAAAVVGEHDDTFFSAGSPWYLTLFGRDSLWSARMTLPLGTDVAQGTLRVLGRRQGGTVDVESAQEPGKILHELRRAAVDLPDVHLPPIYFGSIDATPLWICLLRDAWRWGMDPAEVNRQLDTAVLALEWLATYGDPDGDGFLEYLDSSGRGLTNQGWKDSSDSIRFVDGTIADGPIALAEVQGYAFEAALAGAELLDAFGRPGAARWRSYAAALAQNFRRHFWLSDTLGSFPALALDGAKRQVDSPASNMGHLLGTGLLNRQEAAAVAARLIHPSMSSGFGLRTMSAATGGYSPLSYHCGSVWPHDTAIAIQGLLREGYPAEAATLASGLLAAAATFDGRLPELYGGFDSVDVPVPVPHPASCRPQAWSAAAAVVMLQAFLGLEVDIPAAAVSLRPSAAIGAFAVDGLTIGGRPWRVAVDAAGVAAASPLAGLDIRASRQRG
ncbi:MAG: amylo-alpha-1,6-glucosidase, partial [Actinomycetota bacterium]|nr:amylo-alpha-1,6-glucosidase [Actinomycetota bacterium]